MMTKEVWPRRFLSDRDEKEVLRRLSKVEPMHSIAKDLSLSLRSVYDLKYNRRDIACRSPNRLPWRIHRGLNPRGISMALAAPSISCTRICSSINLKSDI
jgi:hypothetical protein